MTTISQPSAIDDHARFQLAASGPEAYQRHLVPAFFTPCATQLLDLAAPAPGQHVLDIACGTGVVALEAARRVGATGSVTGVDVNQGMLAVARSVATAATPPAPVTWHQGDAGQLAFPDAAFHLVCCQQGIQFFPDPAAALAQMRRVLAPGGRLALTTWRPLQHHPVFAAVATALDRYAGEGTGTALRAPFGGPSGEEYRTLLARAGFTGTRVRIGIVTVRFPSVDDLVRQEALATPAAPAYAAMDEADRTAMVADVAGVIADTVDDEGVTFPMQTWHVTATTT